MRLALQFSIRGESGVWPLKAPGAGVGAGHGGPLLGEDPTLREREQGEDTAREGGEGGGATGRTKGQGRALCSSRTTEEEHMRDVTSQHSLAPLHIPVPDSASGGYSSKHPVYFKANLS